MMIPSTTLVIGASVRPQRICPQIVAWVAETGRNLTGGRFEQIDLRDWPLPMDDEPEIPATGRYVQGHTLAWSEKVKASGAVVFVTPQYNWGYPAPLKNALDHLYHEWSGKPALIITYGGHGGGKCGAQLRQVLDGLHMRVVDAMPTLTLSDARIKANAGEITPGEDFDADLPLVEDGFRALAAALNSR